jgi:hypothetical protein
MIRKILIIAALLLPGFDVQAENRMSDPIPGDPYGPMNPSGESPETQAQHAVHAVMYAFSYDIQTLAITHAQVIGGYPSVDDCRHNMVKVSVAATDQLATGEQLQLQCSGIMEPTDDTDADAAPTTDEPPKPKTPI